MPRRTTTAMMNTGPVKMVKVAAPKMKRSNVMSMTTISAQRAPRIQASVLQPQKISYTIPVPQTINSQHIVAGKGDGVFQDILTYGKKGLNLFSKGKAFYDTHSKNKTVSNFGKKLSNANLHPSINKLGMHITDAGSKLGLGEGDMMLMQTKRRRACR